jgi:hypothetical protein
VTREERVIWAAGFFDGEGCISIHMTAGGDTQLRVIVGQKVREPIDIWKELFPRGNIHQIAKSGMWKWQLTGHASVEVLNELLPYLVNKRPQAEIAVLWAEMDRPARHKAYADLKLLKRVV